MTLLSEIRGMMPSIEKLTEIFADPLTSEQMPAVESLVGDNTNWTYKRYYVPQDYTVDPNLNPLIADGRILLEIKKFETPQAANDWIYQNFILISIDNQGNKLVNMDKKWYNMPFLKYEVPELNGFRKSVVFVGQKSSAAPYLYINVLDLYDIRDFVVSPEHWEPPDVSGLDLYATSFPCSYVIGSYTSRNGKEVNIGVYINTLDVIQCGEFVGVTLDVSSGWLCTDFTPFRPFRSALMFGEGYDSAYSTPYDEPVEILYGCTDPDADNYNPDATMNDGSCTYTIDDNEGPSEDTYGSSFAEIINPLMIMMMGIMMIGIMVNMVRDQNEKVGTY